MVEDLNTNGSADKPGRNRVQKAGLDRVIPGIDWRSSWRMFEYKAANVTVVIAGHVLSASVLDLGRPNAEVDSGRQRRQGDPASFGGWRIRETCVQFEIRKFVTVCEDVAIDSSRRTPAPWCSFAVAAFLAIHWARQFVANLKLEICASGRAIVEMLTDQMFALVGSGQAKEARANAALVGLDGKIEHASSLIHTLQIGNFICRAAAAMPYPSFISTRGTANVSTADPSTDKNADRWRLHDLTIQFPNPNALRADEFGCHARHRDAEPTAFPYWRQDSEPGRSWP